MPKTEAALLDTAGAVLDSLIATKPTRTIGFNSTIASVLSWRADADYTIVRIVGASGGSIVNFGGQTYAVLSSSGVHSDWIGFAGVNTIQELRQPVYKGQLVYCSTNGTAGVLMMLELN